MLARSTFLLLALAAPAVAADFTAEPAEVKVPAGTLKGTLTIPEGKGPFPVALIHAGSGPTDRDCNQPFFLKTDAFKMLAAELANRGVATLRIDKRLVGESLKIKEEDLRFDQYVHDVVAWVELLRKDKRFSRVAFVGHSEGALIGLVAAARAKPDAFVSLCGPGRPVGVVLRAQLKTGLPKLGLSDLYEKSEKVIAELEAGRTVKDYPPELAALFRESVQPFVIGALKHDPPKLIAALDVPVLIVQGEADPQVPVEHGKALAEANKKAKLVTIEKMSHTLKRVSEPKDQQASYASYTDPKLPLAPGLVDALAEFLTAVPAKGR